jgi:hypothetical protein
MSAHHDDFAFEPVRGLPAVLPPGERMLWQGSPRWQDLAVHAFHARKAIWYFAALAAFAAALRLGEGASLEIALRPFGWLIPMGLAAAGLLAGLAYLSARTTVYTITSKRLVMRIGMAVQVSINLPFSQIDSAALRLFGNGSGDIPLKIVKKERLAYLLLWPHARPFYFTRPEPCLRAIPEADRVAGLLAAALAGQSPAPLGEIVPGPASSLAHQPAVA